MRWRPAAFPPPFPSPAPITGVPAAGLPHFRGASWVDQHAAHRSGCLCRPVHRKAHRAGAERGHLAGLIFLHCKARCFRAGSARSFPYADGKNDRTEELQMIRYATRRVSAGTAAFRRGNFYIGALRRGGVLPSPLRGAADADRRRGVGHSRGSAAGATPYRRYRRRSSTAQLAGTSAAGGRLPASPAGKYRRGLPPGWWKLPQPGAARRAARARHGRW